MKNKLRLLVCYLLLCSCVPINSAFAAVSIDNDGDGIHMDDIVYYLSNTGSLLNSEEIRNLLDQIAPVIPLPVADEVAAGITSVMAPAADETSLTLPIVPGGYTIAINSSSNTGVIGTNGAIAPPAAATRVDLVLTVTRTYDNTTANTSTIAVIVPAHVLTADEVAAMITSVTAPAAGVTSLALPTVPSGYTIAINTSSNTGVIGTNGVIAPPAAVTSIDLVFTVTRISDNTTANTSSTTVVIPAIEPLFIPRPLSSINVALASNGGVATASSTLGNFSISSINNGDRTGSNWGNVGGGWNDSNPDVYPDWVQVDFNASQTINEIDVITLRDDFDKISEPTIGMTFNSFGITEYKVQYWAAGDINDWVTVTNGSVTSNNYVWKQFTFAPVVTDKIRLTITDAKGFSRLVELEAWKYNVAP